MTIENSRLLTGDTPTGRLHLGHWVGSLENRLAMQAKHDSYFLIANVHAFTTRMEHPDEIRQSTIDIAIDWLAAGIDPEKSTMFVQSDIPAIAELTVFLSMLLPYPRVLRNPTIKDEIRHKGLGDNYPFGFLLYAVGQMADILTFRPEVVPVGADQIPHIEMTREVARRFNQIYCGVSSHSDDADHVKEGGLFPIPEAIMGRTKRLVGTTGPDDSGKLLKMSKSLNNAILLSDDADTIRKKVMSLYTDPKRLKPTDKGSTENNPLWIFHETFNTDKVWVAEASEKYRNGEIGDVDCKKKLIEVLVDIVEPISKRRAAFADDEGQVLEILRVGAEKANAVADETLQLAKKAMKQDY